MDERERQKLAFGNAAKQLGAAAGQALGTAAVAGAVGLGGVAISKLYDAATKSRDYRKMLAANPEVHAFAQENPNLANQFFTSLRDMNPEFSRDPLVAGHYMQMMAKDPHHAGGYVLQTVGDRRNFDQPLLETYLKGTAEGIKPRAASTLPWGAAPGSGAPGGGGRGPRGGPTGGSSSGTPTQL
jgi:hypothetical protein